MRKYRSTDSHYLEYATCNVNFGSLKKKNSSQPNNQTQKKAIIRQLDYLPEEQIPYIRENTQPEEQSHFIRLPDDIFINEEPLHDSTRQNFSIFKSINAYKKVSYTMMDKSKNVVHCFLEEKNPTDIDCFSWTKLVDRYQQTQFAQLAETIQEFYMKREDWNESLSMSTKDESYQALPDGFSNNFNTNPHIFLNQFQLAQEKEDIRYIEKALSNPSMQQPQIVFRRMFVAGKGTILRSIHINTQFLSLVGCTAEDFLLQTAVRKAIPDIFTSLNYMELMKKAMFKIDNSQQEGVFNHQILSANNQRKLFEREDILINNQQQRILQTAFGIKLDECSSNSSLTQQNISSSQNIMFEKNQSSISQQQSETNIQVSQIEKIFKLRVTS